MLPIPVIGNPNITHGALVAGVFFNRYAQGKYPVGTGNVTTVSIALFLVVIADFYCCIFSIEKQCIVGDRCKIAGGEQHRVMCYSIAHAGTLALRNSLFQRIFPLSHPLSFSSDNQISIGLPTI